MKLSFNERKQAFIVLGQKLSNVLNNVPETGAFSAAEKDFYNEIHDSASKNSWFTLENVKSAMEGVAAMLLPEALDSWLLAYPNISRQVSNPRTVAVIMAGNIPFVGFHDMLCVLLSGNRFLGKLSSQDLFLPVKFAGMLFEAEPKMEAMVSFSDGIIKEFDAVIATGSNNSARYFDYYFGKYPHIIRKNRNSLAVLTGEETKEELTGLSNDIFQFYGMGCRNVSKILVPQDFDFIPLIESFHSWQHLKDHSKYFNNYEYQKAIFLVNQRPHLDNGYCLLVEDERLVSPLAVLHYEFYFSHNAVENYISTHLDALQCVVAREGLRFNTITSVLPGEAQKPRPQDYADGVDTLSFLLDLQ
ncbi:MAG: acyl-CoA reductase [Bacteroidetes bacterium]|nr:MAG: acyl-CoA reductase [Bacteroidota bacterium]